MSIIMGEPVECSQTTASRSVSVGLKHRRGSETSYSETTIQISVGQSRYNDDAWDPPAAHVAAYNTSFTKDEWEEVHAAVRRVFAMFERRFGT